LFCILKHFVLHFLLLTSFYPGQPSWCYWFLGDSAAKPTYVERNTEPALACTGCLTLRFFHWSNTLEESFRINDSNKFNSSVFEQIVSQIDSFSTRTITVRQAKQALTIKATKKRLFFLVEKATHQNAKVMAAGWVMVKYGETLRTYFKTEGHFFSPFCFFWFLIPNFSAFQFFWLSLLLCFSTFPCWPASLALLLFCLSHYSVSLLLCFSASLLLCFFDFLLFCFSVSLPLCFSSFLLFPAFLLFCLLVPLLFPAFPLVFNIVNKP